MLKKYAEAERKYLYVEFFFFVVICILIPIARNFEHGLHFPVMPSIPDQIENELYRGTLRLFFDFTYYRLLIRPFVFNEQWLKLSLSGVIYCIFFPVYSRYVILWTAPHLPFLSERYRKYMAQAFEIFKGPRFDITYTFGSEIILMIGIAYLIRFLQQQQQMQRIKEEQLISEVVYLKAQLQPHFFFNTLNNIYSLAVEKSAPAAAMISRLSEMMRYIIYHAQAEKVTLQQEISFIRDYVELERIRYPDSTKISLEIQGPVEEPQIEPLLLLPFIENAFKHGLQIETAAGFVHIVICLIDDELIVRVENSMPETASKNNNGHGLGLKNVTKRLELLYPEKHQIVVEENLKIYSVHVSINLK